MVDVADSRAGSDVDTIVVVAIEVGVVVDLGSEVEEVVGVEVAGVLITFGVVVDEEVEELSNIAEPLGAPIIFTTLSTVVILLSLSVAL